MFNNGFKIYIPFLIKYINIIKIQELQKWIIINKQDVIELISKLENEILVYLSKNNKREEQLDKISKLVFLILLIKNKYNQLGKEYFPNIFYIFILRFPNEYKRLITKINSDGINYYSSSFLDERYYSTEIQSKIIIYLKTEIYQDLRNKLLKSNNEIYSNYSKEQIKIINTIIIKILTIYNDYHTRIQISNNGRNIEDLKVLFKNIIKEIKDEKIEEIIKSFITVIYNDTYFYIIKGIKIGNNSKKDFINVLTGNNNISNIITLLSKTKTVEIKNNLTQIIKIIIETTNENKKVELYKNYIKISFISLFYDKNLIIRNQVIQIFKENKQLLEIFLKNVKMFEEIIKNFVTTNFNEKFNFKGITNSDKNYYSYEVFGHYIIKFYVRNYLSIIKNFVQNCNNYINIDKRNEIISNSINLNKNLESEFKNLLINYLKNNIEIFLRKELNENQKNLLINCSGNNNENNDNSSNSSSTVIIIDGDDKTTMHDIIIKKNTTNDKKTVINQGKNEFNLN